MEQQLHLLTGSYALNALGDQERNDFERHALSDPQTLEEVRSLSETAALLAYSTAAETPPAELKANVMAAIRNTRQLPASAVVRDISTATSRRPGRRGSRWVPVLSAAAALAIFAGVGVGGWVIGQNSTRQDMEQTIAAMQATQRAAQEQQAAMLGIVGAPDAKIATTELSDGGSVTVASSGKADSAAVMTHGLPALPSDKTYELWFISPAGAVSAGLMGVSAPATPGLQMLQGPMGGATHVGITVEPAGGSAAPTSTPIVVQAL